MNAPSMETPDEPAMIYFVDANVIMYAVGAEHEYKQPCAHILEAIGEERLETRTELAQAVLQLVPDVLVSRLGLFGYTDHRR